MFALSFMQSYIISRTFKNLVGEPQIVHLLSNKAYFCLFN